MSDSDDDFSEGDLGMFEEPAGFRPPSPKPTFTHFDRDPAHVLPGSPARIELRLPAKHSLWGHWVWNAGKVGTGYIDTHKDLVRGKTVLELGAGSALPSLVAIANGAAKTAVTDYPEKALLDNIAFNVDTNFPGYREDGRAVVEGFLWGSDPLPLLDLLPPPASPSSPRGYDLLILTDLIFNHTQQDNLVRSCRDLLAADGRVLLTFSSHVPKKRPLDLAFFPKMDEAGFVVEETEDFAMEPMFGDESYVETTEEDRRVRSTVHLYVFRRRGKE
ncbi:hypothetical protein DFJ74DRAFT_676030 [Hyaloraphidium curvatum]|nr:hypothetical protein DFJ74DRAFT_676030 [Hyaloraphidium curvatum]